MNDWWFRCIEVLRTKVNEHTISLWIDPITCERVTEDKIVLSTPTKFHADWIKENYFGLIRDTLGEIAGTKLEVELCSRDDSPTEPHNLASGISKIPSSSVCDLGVTDSFVLKRRLNPLYTFESFVVGDCNQFAHAAAQAVSEKLGSSYNPLFIYADVGLGKTHLMSAIGYGVLSRDRNKNVYFTTSEEFTNEMINAIQHERMEDFRNKYRKVDLLLIDDIQFLARKERTQEEFFHTFNSIYENRKQIVITSDKFPKDISDMEERLKSRFGWGLVADMGFPDLETRVAILKRKAFEDSVEISDEVALFLAEQADSNIRELVGSLVRLVALSTLQAKPISLDLAEMCFKEKLSRPPKTITIEGLISEVSKVFNVKISDIKSRKKQKIYSRPRQVAMYLARELTELSYPEIGAAFGGKDHSTVIYACKKIEKELVTDQNVKNQVEALKKDIKG